MQMLPALATAPIPGRDDFSRDLVALMPYLRNFSRSLCRKHETAEDIFQDSLAKAWRSRESFEPGTNLKAWLSTILRHEFYSYKRRAWRESRWDEELGDQIPAPPNEQLWAMDVSDCARGLSQLPKIQRDALLLVGAGGFSYPDAGSLMGTSAGTMKSRASRARKTMTDFFEGERPLPARAQTLPSEGLNGILVQLSALTSAIPGGVLRA